MNPNRAIPIFLIAAGIAVIFGHTTTGFLLLAAAAYYIGYDAGYCECVKRNKLRFGG